MSIVVEEVQDPVALILAARILAASVGADADQMLAIWAAQRIRAHNKTRGAEIVFLKPDTTIEEGVVLFSGRDPHAKGIVKKDKGHAIYAYSGSGTGMWISDHLPDDEKKAIKFGSVLMVDEVLHCLSFMQKTDRELYALASDLFNGHLLLNMQKKS